MSAYVLVEKRCLDDALSFFWPEKKKKNYLTDSYIT